MAVRDDFAPGEVLTAADLNDTLASKADASAVTGSNLLYNGAMQVAQRGTSTASITTSGYYTADRWGATVGTLGTWTQSVENDGPSGSGLVKSLKMLCTTADAAPSANDACIITQTLEGQDVQRIAKGTTSAQQLTLSFWVKSNTTGTYICDFLDHTNSRRISVAYTISASATWEKKSLLIASDTTGTITNNDAAGFTVSFWLGAGSTFTSGTLQTAWGSAVNANRAVGQTNLAATTNNYWQITGVQLEVGPVATGFEFKSFGQELRECQRYYWRMTPGGTYYRYGLGSSETTSSLNVVVQHPVTMRVGPTSIQTTGTAGDYIIYEAGNFRTCTALPTIAAATSFSTCINNTAANLLTVGRAGELIATNATSYIGLSAEL